MTTLLNNISTSFNSSKIIKNNIIHNTKKHQSKNIQKNNNFTINKPNWIRVKAPNSNIFKKTNNIIRNNNLVTVCEEANCPNIGECWSKKHATIMIMGNICTRKCTFCNIRTGIPKILDINEPYNVGQSVKQLNLNHVVITSVDRDDLKDGGAQHFVKTIQAIRKAQPNTTIEILTPDFLRKKRAIETIVAAKPDVFNHNLETVPSKYLKIRPGARYFHSLRILQMVKEINPNIFTKSGIMLGLGEKKSEILQVMDDMRAAKIDFITMGQYLQPTINHQKIQRFVTPEEFKKLKLIAKIKGFLMISSSPLTRSSYHADEDFIKLRKIRLKKT